MDSLVKAAVVVVLWATAADKSGPGSTLPACAAPLFPEPDPHAAVATVKPAAASTNRIFAMILSSGLARLVPARPGTFQEFSRRFRWPG